MVLVLVLLLPLLELHMAHPSMHSQQQGAHSTVLQGCRRAAVELPVEPLPLAPAWLGWPAPRCSACGGERPVAPRLGWRRWLGVGSLCCCCWWGQMPRAAEVAGVLVAAAAPAAGALPG